MRRLRKTEANLNNEPIEGWNVIRKGSTQASVVT